MIDGAQTDSKSLGSADDLNTLAYKTMNPLVYYVVTMLIYLIEVFLSIKVDSIGTVFSFIATFAGTGLCFLIPSTLFSMGYWKFASQEYKDDNKCFQVLSLINFGAGFLFFGLFLYANIEAIK